MRKMGSSSKSTRGGKRQAETERLAGYKREVARLTEENRGQQRLLDALLLPRIQLENTGPFKLPSHLLHCSSSVGVTVDPEGPGPGALSKCTQTKLKEEMEDHDEVGAAGEPEKADSEATDSDFQSGHLEEIVDDLSGIETEDSEDGDYHYYPQKPCKLTPQTQGKKSKEPQEGGGGVVVSVAQSNCRPTPHSCKVCPASFPNGSLFLWHIHEHKQECAWCGLRLRATQSLKAHMQTHTQCPSCEKTFRSYRNLKQHIRIYVTDKNFGCAECGKQFQRRFHLERHAKGHTAEKNCRATPQSCKVCPASFPNGKLFLRHIHKHKHKQKCAWCGLRMRDTQSLRDHMQTHTQCPGCEKTFSSFQNLKKHIRSYVPDKTFDCAECGRQFQRRENLDRHAKCHTGEMPLKCDECGKGFAEQYRLDQHMRTHTGEKPFSCTICDVKFTQKGNMLSHMKVHP